MPDPIFERYKEALRAGHVAALRGRLDDALIQYRRAAAIADERALPHASMAGVLLRMGRAEESAAAYGRALERSPADEAALTGRADALVAAGRPAEAAQTLDRLADVLEAAGRPADALAALQRALAMAQTRRRRNRAKALAQAVRAGRQADATVPPPAMGVLEPDESAEGPSQEGAPGPREAGGASTSSTIPADAARPPDGGEARFELATMPAPGPAPVGPTAPGAVSGPEPARAAPAWPDADRRPADRGAAGDAVPRAPVLEPASRSPAPPAAGAMSPGRAPAGTAPEEDAAGATHWVLAAPPLSAARHKASGGGPPPSRDAIAWPQADLAQRRGARAGGGGEPGREGGEPPAVSSDRDARGPAEPVGDSDGADAGDDGAAGTGTTASVHAGASALGRAARGAEELIGLESVPALGSEPEQRVSAAEHAEATGARETAVWLYVQAAEGFTARDASEAALDACHRALDVSPGSADAHLALARIYLARGWRDRAADKLVLLDRLLELDRATPDRERLASFVAEHFPGDLRFAKT